MLIDVTKMRLLKTRDPEVRFKLIKQNLERFFRDYIYYYNVYDRDELIIDSGYLPYHYLDEEVINKVINLLENELGYSIIIMKTSNIKKIGYLKDDLISIRIFDKQVTTPKEVDDYFNLRTYQPLYSSFHNFYNLDGRIEKLPAYLSCLDVNELNETNQNRLNNNVDEINTTSSKERFSFESIIKF
ncbi:MAG: hypothetical protein RR290_04730 [Clostridia bacterium]